MFPNIRKRASILRPSKFFRRMNSPSSSSLAQSTCSTQGAKSRFEDGYLTEKPPLGKGGFGKVWKAFKKGTNSGSSSDSDTEIAIPFAVKEISKQNLSQSGLIGLKLEVEALKCLNHKNIIEFFEEYDEVDRVYIVMEYVTGGTLEEMLEKNIGFSEEYVKQYVYQITCALEHCKQKGVVHRDIKPGNILITGDVDDSPMVKLLDFGFSAIIDVKAENMEDKVLNKWCGTSFYASPEIVKRQTYNFKTDFWSLGVVIYELLSGGTKPFSFDVRERGSKTKMLKKIAANEWQFKPEHAWRSISEEAKELIENLLVLDVDERYGAKETLDHAWLTKELENDKTRIMRMRGGEDRERNSVLRSKDKPSVNVGAQQGLEQKGDEHMKGAIDCKQDEEGESKSKNEMKMKMKIRAGMLKHQKSAANYGSGVGAFQFLDL